MEIQTMEENKNSKAAHDLPANNPSASPHRPPELPTPVPMLALPPHETKIEALRIVSGGLDCIVCGAASIYDAIKQALDHCKPRMLGVLIRVYQKDDKVVLMDTIITLKKIGEEGWQRVKIK